jgi:Fe-Mn family superoxide dismutase
MSSSGWVWCVQDPNGALGIVPTFGHGTVLVRNRLHRSPFLAPVAGEITDPRTPPSKDPAAPPTATSPASGTSVRRTGGGASDKSRTPPSRPVGTHAPAYTGGALTSQLPGINFTKIGSILSPLFCISINEHAWISSGYGVWGKEEYLKRFWSVLDWKKVSSTSEFWMGSSITR